MKVIALDLLERGANFFPRLDPIAHHPAIHCKGFALLADPGVLASPTARTVLIRVLARDRIVRCGILRVPSWAQTTL